MKVVSSWPDYTRLRIVAVCEDGTVYSLYDDGTAIGQWLRMADSIDQCARVSSDTEKCPGGHLWLPWGEPYKLVDMDKTMQTRNCGNLACRFQEDREVTKK